MAKTNTPLGQLVAVIPATSDSPDVRGDLLTLATEIEKKLLMRYASRTARDAAVTVPADGMRTYIDDVDEIDERINGAWTKVWPKLYSGTSDPSNSVGIVGDVYFKYT